MSNASERDHSKRYFVYTLAHPNGRIFYVGKGSGDRPLNHLTEARVGFCHCPKCKMIRKIWKERLEVRIEYIFQSNDEGETLDQERKSIDELRRVHPLCNWQGCTRRKEPLQPRSALTMSLTEYRAHLDYYKLSKKEVGHLMREWGRLRGYELEKQWQRARRMHLWEEAEELVKEIEELNAATGIVWQLHLPFDQPRKKRSGG